MVEAWKDPYRGYRFKIEIEGIVVGGFSEATGLQVEKLTEEVAEGGVNDTVYIIPKGTKYQNLVLKRGLTDSTMLERWQKEVIDGSIKRRTVHVILLDADGSDAARWSFIKTFPVKWVCGELKADSNSVVFETLELAHQGFGRY